MVAKSLGCDGCDLSFLAYGDEEDIVSEAVCSSVSGREVR